MYLNELFGTFNKDFTPRADRPRKGGDDQHRRRSQSDTNAQYHRTPFKGKGKCGLVVCDYAPAGNVNSVQGKKFPTTVLPSNKDCKDSSQHAGSASYMPPNENARRKRI